MEPLVEAYPQYAEYGDMKDISPLHWACYHGHYEMVQLLLDKVRIDVFVYKYIIGRECVTRYVICQTSSSMACSKRYAAQSMCTVYIAWCINFVKMLPSSKQNKYKVTFLQKY